MGTRSTIAIEFADGSVSQVYCHWEGYLENNGQLLAEHYMDPFKVRELVDLGSLSVLGAEIGVKRPFDNLSKYGSAEYLEFRAKWDGQCLFYARDRGEDVDINRYMNVDEYFDLCQQEEYNYILRNVAGKATWFVRFNDTDGVWVTMAEAFEMNKECA